MTGLFEHSGEYCACCYLKGSFVADEWQALEKAFYYVDLVS